MQKYLPYLLAVLLAIPYPLYREAKFYKLKSIMESHECLSLPVKEDGPSKAIYLCNDGSTFIIY